MSASSEAPSFAVGAQDDPNFHSTLPENATLLWPDIPNIYVWGNLEEHRLRTASNPLGRVALIGDCFADQKSLDTALSVALGEQHPGPLTYLPGSYVTILQREGRISVSRDIAGIYPIYFRARESGITVSSDPSVAAGAKLMPNLAQTITNLVFLAPNEGQMAGNASCFDGVDKLMGGQAITLGADGSHVAYTYERLIPDPKLTRATAAVELRAALREAVQARIRSGAEISANLSGGVDSSSIVALALETLASDKTLPVFFMDSPNQEGGDKKFVNRYLQQDSRLQPTFFDMESMPHILPNLPITRQQGLSSVAHPARESFLSSYYKVVSRTGSGKLHFTGNGGDEVIGTGPYYLPDLLWQGHISRFLREGREWARIYNTSPFKIWRAMGRLALHGPKGALLDAARHIETGSDSLSDDPVSALEFWQPDKVALSWLTPHAREVLKEYLLGRVQDIYKPEISGVGDFIASERIHAAGSDQGLEMSNVPPGISLQSPFLDHNVLRAASAAAAIVKGSPYEFKLLLRDALKDIAPEYILQRSSKGIYNPTSQERHFEALRTLNEFLDDSILVRLGIIDPNPVRKELAHIEMIPPNTMWALTQILTTERWLRSLDLPDGLGGPQQETSSSVQVQHNGPPRREGHLTIPSHIYSLRTPDGSLLILNQQTNQYHPLSITQSNTLRVLASRGTIEKTIQMLSEVYSDVALEELAANTHQMIKNFEDLGIVVPSAVEVSKILPTEKPHRFVSEEFNTAHTTDEHLTQTNKYIADLALVGAQVISRFMPDRRRQFLESLHRRWATRPATQEEAIQVMLAVQSSRYMGRLACLQASYTAAIALAMKRRKVDWHVGASFAPLDIHAWIEAEGKPVRTSKDGRVTGSYQSFFS